MKRLLAAAAVAASLTPASQALAGVFVSASVSDQTTHLLYTSTETEYGSASLDVELGRFIRLGYTYGMEQSKSTTFKDPGALDGTQPNTTGYCQAKCDKTYQNQNVVSHSLGLTVVLYEGQVITPFLLGGAIKKIVTVDSLDYDHNGNLVHLITSPPEPIGPYAGLGLSIRMSRNFSLKLTYQISPGYVLKPYDPKLYTIWDRQWTVGLQYQL